MNNINEFFNALHSRLPEDQFVELRAFNKVKKLKPVTAFVTTAAAAEEFAVEHMHERDVYIGVCPRWQLGSGKQGSGKNTDVNTSYWIWADFDAKDFGVQGEALIDKVLRRMVLTPTIIVSSGSGGMHIYWAIDPTNDLARVQKLNDAISDWFKIAHVGDPAHILRVAGTINHKSDPPLPVRLLHYDANNLYALDDIEAAVNVSEAVAELVHVGNLAAYDSRSERDFAVIGGLIHAGFSDEAIYSIYNKRAVGAKYRDEGEHYLEFTISKLRTNDGVDAQFAPVIAKAGGKNSKWQIVEKGCCYWRLSEGGLTQLSTFTFDPKIVLEGDFRRGEPDTLIGTICVDGAEWPNVALTRDAFNKSDALVRQLPKATWQWFGRDPDVRKLLPYLLDKLADANDGSVPTRLATPIVGRHNGTFVAPEQTIDASGVVDENEATIVWLPTGREYPRIAYAPYAGNVGQIVDDFVSLYFGVNTPEVTYGALGYFCAALLKPVLERQSVRMPALNVYGTRGSGKTSLITRVLQPLVGYTQPRTYDANTTPFVMLSMLGSSNAIPISFSEYRRSTQRDPERFLHLLRIAYDSGYDNRGKADQTMKEYPLTAPITVDGEDAISDPASLERIIQVNLHPETIAENTEAYAAFQQLLQIDIHALALPLVQFSLTYEPDFDGALDDMRRFFNMPLPDRVRRNVAVVLVGLRMFEAFAAQYGAQLPAIDFDAVFRPILESVVNLASGRTNLMVDEFIADLVNFVARNEGADQFVYAYDTDASIFYFQMRPAYNWWVASRNLQRLPTLELRAITQQIRERIVFQDQVPMPGKYVYDSHTKTINKGSVYVYGVNLVAARDTGLDVPDKLDRFTPTTRIATSVKVGI